MGLECKESEMGLDFLGQTVSSWEDNEMESGVAERSFSLAKPRSWAWNSGTPGDGNAEALSST